MFWKSKNFKWPKRLLGRLSADDVRIGAIRTLYAEIIGISRVPCLPLLAPRTDLGCPSAWFPISPFSRPGFLALQLERLATSSSLRRRRRRSSTRPARSYGFTLGKLWETPAFQGSYPCTSVSLSLSFCPFRSCDVFFHPYLRFPSLISPLFLCSICSLAFSWRELRTISTEFERKQRSPSNLSPLMTLRDWRWWFIVLKMYHKNFLRCFYWRLFSIKKIVTATFCRDALWARCYNNYFQYVATISQIKYGDWFASMTSSIDRSRTGEA